MLKELIFWASLLLIMKLSSLALKNLYQIEKQLKKIAKEIASNYDDWKKGSSQSGYSHSLILEDYPEYTLAIKEIEKPNLNELNNTNKDDSDNK